MKQKINVRLIGIAILAVFAKVYLKLEMTSFLKK